MIITIFLSMKDAFKNFQEPSH